MRKLLYIVYIPLLIIEWTADMIGKIWEVFHNSIKTLALATENIINEPDRPTPTNETGTNAA